MGSNAVAFREPGEKIFVIHREQVRCLPIGGYLLAYA